MDNALLKSYGILLPDLVAFPQDAGQLEDGSLCTVSGVVYRWNSSGTDHGAPRHFWQQMLVEGEAVPGLSPSQIVETDGSSKLTSAAKNTGYNLPKATTAEINTGTEANKVVVPDQLQASKYLDQSGSKLSATAAGTDTYTATMSPAITSYSSTLRVFILFTNANTGAATLNLNGLGAKTIQKNGAALIANDILAGGVYALLYDGTNFQLAGNAVRKATTAEINTGTEANKSVYPDQLAGSKYLDQSGSKIYAVTSGTDTYTASISPAITAYATGQAFLIKFGNANTGAATINLNSLGVKSLKKNDGTALVANDIVANQIYLIVYDGTNFQLEGSTGGSVGSQWAAFIFDVYRTDAATLAGNSNTFAGLGGGAGSISATEANVQVRMPACRIRSVFGKVDGGNSDCTFTINKNGVATALTGTVVNDSTKHFRVTSGGPVTFAAGDLLSLHLVTTSGSGFTFRGLFIDVETDVLNA